MKMARYEVLWEYMLGCASDFAHGEDHVRCVLNIAIDIARTVDDVNMDALLCACLLHDVGRGEQLADPSRHHAKVGAEKARAYLIGQGWDTNFADLVADVISAHSSAELAGMRGIEVKILYDADKLDQVGSIGLCRTIAYGVEAKERIYDASDLSGVVASKTGTIFRAAMSDMVSVEGALFTERARQLAERRIHSMRMFLEALKSEAVFGETVASDF